MLKTEYKIQYGHPEREQEPNGVVIGGEEVASFTQVEEWRLGVDHDK